MFSMNKAVATMSRIRRSLFIENLESARAGTEHGL
jgi:hypothetical protein